MKPVLCIYENGLDQKLSVEHDNREKTTICNAPLNNSITQARIIFAQNQSPLESSIFSLNSIQGFFLEVLLTQNTITAGQQQISKYIPQKLRMPKKSMTRQSLEVMTEVFWCSDLVILH